MLLVDVTRTISVIEPWKAVVAALVAIRRWRAARRLSVTGMSEEWLAEHEQRSSKSGGSV